MEKEKKRKDKEKENENEMGVDKMGALATPKAPYWILRPHPLAAVWRYRDGCARRRLEEIHACK